MNPYQSRVTTREGVGSGAFDKLACEGNNPCQDNNQRGVQSGVVGCPKFLTFLLGC
jgi:hypothetical protein